METVLIQKEKERKEERLSDSTIKYFEKARTVGIRHFARSQEEILAQMNSNLELADLIRSFNGKYKQEKGMLFRGKPEENRRCVMGALMTEFGWNTEKQFCFGSNNNFSRAYKAMLSKFPQLSFGGIDGHWNELAEMNNSGKNWNELADFVEGGFKD